MNAGCRITSIQKFLGHKKLDTTLIYAKAHDQTVESDYFAAMQRIEARLEIAPVPVEEPPSDGAAAALETQRTQLLLIAARLAAPEVETGQRLQWAAQMQAILSKIFTPPLPFSETFGCEGAAAILEAAAAGP